MYPLPYPLSSLSAVPFISRFYFLCTYQYYSPMIFSSTVVSNITYLCLRHPCYPTPLLCLCCLCLYSPKSLPLPSSLLCVSLDPSPPCISTHHCKASNYHPPSYPSHSTPTISIYDVSIYIFLWPQSFPPSISSCTLQPRLSGGLYLPLTSLPRCIYAYCNLSSPKPLSPLSCIYYIAINPYPLPLYPY